MILLNEEVPDKTFVMNKIFAICIILFLALPAYSMNSDEMHEMLGPNISDVQPYLDLKFHREPEENTNQIAQHKLTLYELFIQATLFPSITDRQLSIQLKGKMSDLMDGLVLPNTGLQIQEPLFDPGLGATYRMKLSDDAMLGMNLSLSSASEAPFNDGHHPDVGANIFYRFPFNENEGWIIYLHYDSIREYLPNAPVPGAGYIFKYDDNKLHAVIGAPYAEAEWKPLERLSLKADWQYPRHLRTEAGVRILSSFILHGNFDWRQERFRNKDRVRDENMLNYYEKLFYGGLRYEIGNGVFGDVYAGKAFDRFWFEGENYGDRNYNRIEVDDGFVYGLRFKTTF